jgi:hypothetical protein
MYILRDFSFGAAQVDGFIFITNTCDVYYISNQRCRLEVCIGYREWRYHQDWSGEWVPADNDTERLC